MTKQYTNEAVLDGYWKDAKGALIPESMIKDIDLEREKLIADIVNNTKALNNALRKFKDSSFNGVALFIEKSAEQYDVNLGGKKGNVTLFSFDGKYKVQRAYQDCIACDERIEAAQALTLECIKDWSNGSRAELVTLVNRAFTKDNNGNIKLGRLLELRRYNFDDERWNRAMDAIAESIQVVGSRSYIRVYQRVGTTNEYRQISLDIARV